jgi:hypothetical protein
MRVVVRATSGGVETQLLARNSQGESQTLTPPDLKAAVGQVAEIQVPFRAMGVSRPAPVAFIVTLHRGATEIEHHPRHRPIEFEVPDKDFASLNWTA